MIKLNINTAQAVTRRNKATERFLNDVVLLLFRKVDSILRCYQNPNHNTSITKYMSIILLLLKSVILSVISYKYY